MFVIGLFRMHFLIAFFLISFAAILTPAKSATGVMTHYDTTGTKTACGGTYTNDDAIVAIPSSYFTNTNRNKDPICGKRIRIFNPTTKVSVDVIVENECASCIDPNIDVTPPTFNKLTNNQDLGTVEVQWEFIEGN